MIIQLSPHFFLSDLIRSEYALRHGLDNSPSPEVVGNLHILADGLERVQGVLGERIIVSSAYRSPKVNTAIGGAKESYHLLGLACDFTVDGMAPIDVCTELVAAIDVIQFDKIILEYGHWTHIQFPQVDAKPRLTAWTIRNKIEGYQSGLIA